MKLVRVVVFAVFVLLGFFLATQYVASELSYHPALGRPWFSVGFPIYPPWMCVVWDSSLGEGRNAIFSAAWTILVAGLTFAIVSTAALRALRKEDKHPVTYGSARWAGEKEIEEANLYSGRGVVLGMDPKGLYLTDDGDRHVKVFAPTRSGKGVGIVIPTLLNWPDSVLVTDPKGENWELTSGFRKKFSDVIYFNPTDLRSAHFNPLLEVRRGISEVKDVQNIADMIVDPDGKGNTDHWAKTGHSLLVGAILHVLYAADMKEKSLAGVAKLLSNPRMTIEETLEMMMKGRHFPDGSTHPQVAAAARDMLNKSFDERSGVLSTAMVTLSIYRDPIVAEVTKDSDFRIEDFVSGKRPLSVYLVIPGSDISRLRALFRLMINQFCRRLTETLEYERGQQSEHRGSVGRLMELLGASKPKSYTTLRCKPRKHKLLILLDEFPAFGRLEFFDTTLAYIAQYGMKAMLISQSINQLTKEYSQQNSIIDNCHIRIVHAPNTIETAELISRMLGQKTEIRKNKSYGGSRLGFFLGHLTEGEHETGRPLLTPGEVMELNKEDEIVFISNRPPIRCKKVVYYQKDVFKERLLPSPFLAEAGRYQYGPLLTSNDWLSSGRGLGPDSAGDSHEQATPQEVLPFSGKRRRVSQGDKGSDSAISENEKLHRI